MPNANTRLAELLRFTLTQHIRIAMLKGLYMFTATPSISERLHDNLIPVTVGQSISPKHQAQ